MPRFAVLTGVLLIILGALFYMLSEGRSTTPLIPAMFGVLIALGGFVAMRPAGLKFGMHLSAVIALIGLLGSLFGRGGFSVPGWIAALSGEPNNAAFSQMAMFIFCGVFLIACVRWFASNRRARATG